MLCICTLAQLNLFVCFFIFIFSYYIPSNLFEKKRTKKKIFNINTTNTINERQNSMRTEQKNEKSSLILLCVYVIICDMYHMYVTYTIHSIIHMCDFYDEISIFTFTSYYLRCLHFLLFFQNAMQSFFG